MTLFRFLVLMAVCAVWGIHFTVIKSTIDNVPPIFYVAIRMVLVAAILAPLLKWHIGQMPRVFAAALSLGFINYAFLFSGLKLVPASLGAILIEFYVPIAMIFSVLFLNERVGWRRIAGAVLACSGVFIIVSGGGAGLSVGDRFFLGASLILMAAVAEASGAILIKKIEGVSPLQLLAWFAVVGASCSMLLTLTIERDQLAFLSEPGRIGVLGALLYSALGASLFGHATYYWLLQRVDVSQLAPAGLMTTVIGVAAGVFILGEIFTFRLAIGAIVTMTGVAIIVFRSAQKATEKEAEPLPIAGPATLRFQENLSFEDEEHKDSDNKRKEKGEIDALYDK